MTGLDWAVLVACLLGTAFVGVSFSGRQDRLSDYFLAGRTMRWLPIGLSIMATAFNAINYTAFSGEVFEHGLYVTLSLPVFVLVAWPITRVIMPFYHSMRLCSAYEYVERRFDGRVRRVASGLFILWCLAWMSVAIFALCRVLNAITGLPFFWIVAASVGVGALYTMAGGMRAVMWTDVVQFFIILAGLVVAIGVAVSREPGGLGGMLRLGIADGLARPFHPFDPAILSGDPGILSGDPRVRITLWSALIGTFVVFLGRYSADQVIVQRYFTARSLRDAQRGFRLNYASALVTLLALAVLGFAIHAHAVRAGTLGVADLKPVDYFAAFVTALPRGVCGLIVAGLFAATMSSVDSGINSCSAALMTDFWRARRGGPEDMPGAGGQGALAVARASCPCSHPDSFATGETPVPQPPHVGGELPSPQAGYRLTADAHRGASEDAAGAAGRRAVRAGRIQTVAFGLLAGLLALYVGRFGTIFEIANKIINGLGSPLLAVLLLGMFSRRANSRGMLIGAVIGTGWSVAAVLLIDGLALHYYAVLNLAVTLAACWGASLVAERYGGGSSPEQLAWTWRERRGL